MDMKQYIQIPYADKGRTPAGVDCWGLVRLIYRNEFGVDLPSYADRYPSAQEIREASKVVVEERLEWEDVESGSEIPGDLVILRLAGFPTHVGVVIDPLRKLFIHVMKGSDSVIERYTSVVWRNRFEGFVRHRSMPCVR